MTDPAPTVVDPTAPPAAVETPPPAATEPGGVHPSWEPALAAIPDMLRKPILEQIAVSEREAQAAIEKARAESTPEEWRNFIAEAQKAEVNPNHLTDAWNASLAIRQDPQGFYETLGAQIDAAVKAGTLTRKEGTAAKAEVRDAIQEVQNDGIPDELLTPEQKEIKELKTKLEQLSGTVTQTAAEREAERTAEAERKAQQDANDYATAFIAKLEAATPTVTAPARQFVGRAADAILRAAPQTTLEDALAQAIVQAKEAGIPFPDAAPVTVAKPAAPMVGGGATHPGPAAPAKPANDREAQDARTAAMLAAAELAKAGD